MAATDTPSPRERRVRSALAWFAAAALLVPARMLLDGLMPSIENTIIDEIPSQLLFVASGVFATAGVARLVQAMRTPRRLTHDAYDAISEADVAAAKARLDAARQSHAALRGPTGRSRVTERYHTPV